MIWGWLVLSSKWFFRINKGEGIPFNFIVYQKQRVQGKFNIMVFYVETYFMDIRIAYLGFPVSRFGWKHTRFSVFCKVKGKISYLLQARL